MVTLVLLGLKLAVGLLTGSLSILSQAADSAFDLIALGVTLMAVRVSARPPDDDHPYGHGKFENLSALFQSLLLCGLTVAIGIEAVRRLTGLRQQAVEVTWWSAGVLLLSIAIDAVRARTLQKASKASGSQALEAGALNFFTDIVSAAIALASLGAVYFFDIQNFDSIGALIVSTIVLWLGMRLGKRAIDGLTDRFEGTEEYSRLNDTVNAVRGIEEIRWIRARRAGPTIFVEVSVAIDRVLPFAAVEKILGEVRMVISREIERSEATVHWVPMRTQGESPFATLKLLTAEYGVFPHNVELTEDVESGLSLDYHLEFPPGISFDEAHATSEIIEAAVREQLPSIKRVTTHLEEERSDRVPEAVRNVAIARASLLEEIRRYALIANREVKRLEQVHLTERLADRELKLSLTLIVAKEIKLSTAHDIVTNVEDELRKRFPELARIVIHAEPE